MKNAFPRWPTSTMTPAEVAARAERQAEVTERIAGGGWASHHEAEGVGDVP